MKVAMYYPWVYLTSGVERMIVELVKRSEHRWTIFTNHFDRRQTFPELLDMDVVELPRISVKRSYASVAAGALRVMTQKLDLSDYDALLVHSEGIGDLITFRNHQVPTFCFCHTPLRPVFDPVYRQTYLEGHPHKWPALMTFSTLFRWLDRLAWRYYDRVFCNSGEVWRRALRGGLAPPDKLEILYPGIDTGRMQPSWHYEPYFLVPGRIKWTKNVQLGIRAFKRLKATRPDLAGFQLVIAGIVDTKSHAYYRELQALAGSAPDIRFVVHPSDEVLFGLYRHCWSIVFTSLNEDWGLVPLEGMAFGKPVIAVHGGGPRESVVDGVTGFLLDPTPGAFAEAMAMMATQPQLTWQMGKAAHEHAQQFDWSHFVRRIDSYITGLVRAKKSALAAPRTFARQQAGGRECLGGEV